MKKNLIALAMLGAFSGAALAQSNVTLYGIIDVNYQYNDPNVGGQASTSGVNGGHQSGNRWGIRGSEALSPSLNAVFTLESGFNIDTGTSAQDGRLFGRQAWGGLQGGWGTLVAGRVATFSSGAGSFDKWGNIDPFLASFGDSGLGSTFTPSGTLRVDNAALYNSPTLGGFSIGAAYSFNGNGPEAAGTGNNNRVLSFGANYAAGPFYAAITYDVIELNNAGTPGNATTPAIPSGAADQKMLQIGATFDFKFVKLHGAYAKEDSVWLTVGFAPQVDAGADATAWMLGVTAPVFGGSLLASYQQRDGDTVNVCLGSFVPATGLCTAPLQSRERSIDEWAVGYTYPLSRRTNLYINYSDRDGEQSVYNNATINRKQYTVGFRHLF